MSIIQLAEKLYTVDDYYKMAEIGILKPSDKVELINGKIFYKNPITSKDSAYINCLNRRLHTLIDNRIVIGVKSPVRINNFSEPEPDVALLKPRNDFYDEKHAEPDDVLLLIEVSLSTLDIDRKVKLPLYAEAGIQEYWIVNVKKKTIEVYTNPKGKKYTDKTIAKGDDKINISSLDKTVKVSDLLV